jgi:hypothetical protein
MKTENATGVFQQQKNWGGGDIGRYPAGGMLNISTAQ